MTLEIAKKCIDDLTLFPQKITMLSFWSQGEPLLNKEIPKIILYAKQKNIAKCIEITTNASLLTHELSDKLIDAGVDKIFISLYGISDDHYKKIAGQKIKFTDLVDNIKYLFDNRKSCKVHIKIFDEAFEKPDDEKWYYDTFSLFCDTISVEHIIAAFYDMNFEDVNLNYLQLGENAFGKPIEHRKICPYPFYYMVINPDGNVIPCLGDWKEKMVLGNVKEKSLYEIWNGDVLFELQRRDLLNGWQNLCSGCGCPDYLTLDNIDGYEDAIMKKLHTRGKK
jgi:radical SAM protein with 4Fe4S-binding SPASM domain